MNSQRVTWKFAALAWLIIAAGLPMRFDLAQRMYLDFDEAMYFQAANEPTAWDSWEASRIHTHPPLAFVLYHFWLPLGNSEWVLRLPSILCGAAATWVAYLWLTRLTDRRAALAGILVLTFSMPVLHVSAQMRSYSFLLLFLFAALWFDERFRETGQMRHLIGTTLCLLLSLLTHYATAWVIGILGLINLVRAAARGINAPATRAWVASQFVLATECVWLYLTHVRGFVGSDIQGELWASLTHGNAFGDSPSGRLTFALMGWGRFFGAMSGLLWAPMLIVFVKGVCDFARRGSRGQRINVADSRSPSRSWNERTEAVILVVVPIVVATLLQVTLVYPLGATRHSLWLMPFVTLGIAAGLQTMLAKPQLAWRLGIAGVGLFWAWLYPFRMVSEFQTELTPELMQRVADQLKSSVRRDELILTDEASRHVLAYYLGRESVDRGREIARGFREYQIDGFRIVTIPKFHTHWYSLREDWNSFELCLGPQTTQPLWLVHMGFEVPSNGLRELGRRLPPAKILKRHQLADNHLLRVQFSQPKPNREAPVAATGTAKPAAPASSENVRADSLPLLGARS